MTIKPPEDQISDEDWEKAAPLRGEVLDAEPEGEPASSGGTVIDTDPDTDEEDEAPSRGGGPFGDLEPPDDIEPLKVQAELLVVKAGPKGDSTAQFELPWTSVLSVFNSMKKALQLRFGGVDIYGASVKSTAGSTDADGGIRFKVTFEIPESQKEQASHLFMASGKMGDLEVEPTQLSLNLTARAE